MNKRSTSALVAILAAGLVIGPLTSAQAAPTSSLAHADTDTSSASPSASASASATSEPTTEDVTQKLSGIAAKISRTAGTKLTVTVSLSAATGQKVHLQKRNSSGKYVSVTTKTAPKNNASSGKVSITLPTKWWTTANTYWRVTTAAATLTTSTVIKNVKTGTLSFHVYSKRVYTNPSKYFTVSEANTSFKHYKPRNLVLRTEGIRVNKLIKKYHIKGARGAMWGKVSNSFKSRIKSLQKRYNKKHKSNKVRTDGVVDYKTWRALGFSKSSWYLDRYASPTKTTRASTKKQHIEAMIKRAYQYKGNKYIVGASSTPSYGLDCSGLVAQAMYAAGVKGFKNTPMWHSQPGGEWGSRWLFKTKKLKKVKYSSRKRGDLVFYRGSSGNINHVAIYLGGNKVIESWPGHVMVSKIKNGSHSRVAGIKRIFN